MCSTPGRPPGSPSVSVLLCGLFLRLRCNALHRQRVPVCASDLQLLALTVGRCSAWETGRCGNLAGWTVTQCSATVRAKSAQFRGPMINDAIRPVCSAGRIGNPAGRDASFFGRSPGCRRDVAGDPRFGPLPRRTGEIWPGRGHVLLRSPARRSVITNWTNAIVQRHHGQHVCVGRRPSAPAR